MDFPDELLDTLDRKRSHSSRRSPTEASPLIAYTPPLTPAQLKLSRLESAGVPSVVDGFSQDDGSEESLGEGAHPGAETQGTSSTLAVSVALLMTVIGAGILSIPYTFVLVGPHNALVGLVLVALAMCYTGELLLGVHVTTGIGSLEECAVSIMGGRWSLVVPAVTSVGIFGACVSYVAIVRDLIPNLEAQLGFCRTAFSSSTAWCSPSLWTMVIFGVIVFPFCVVKSIGSLRFSSFIGLLFSMYVVLQMVIEAFMAWQQDRVHDVSDINLADFGNMTAMMKVISIFNFAYVYHVNVIPLYRTLRVKGPNRMTWIIRGVVFVSTIIYAIFGYMGSKVYGLNTHSNVLVNFNGSPRMQFAKVAAVFVMMFAFPLAFFPLRSMLHTLIFTARPATSLINSIVEAGSLLSLIIFCGLIVPGISVVFAVTGGTSVLGICYLFPALFHIRLANRTIFRFLFTCAIVFVATFTGLWATIGTLVHLVHGES